MPRRRRRRRGRRINDKSAVERDMSDEDGTAPLNDEASCSPSSELFEDTAIFGSSDVNGKKKMLHQAKFHFDPLLNERKFRRETMERRSAFVA